MKPQLRLIWATLFFDSNVTHLSTLFVLTAPLSSSRLSRMAMFRAPLTLRTTLGASRRVFDATKTTARRMVGSC